MHSHLLVIMEDATLLKGRNKHQKGNENHQTLKY